ncbi:exonuclease domain-containing protein [Arthrobacter citreus]|uniref:exonuclease domain-containing protein n=1 Tax=Arthrobacter citreus TaxID=1670 RepID=UPI0036D9939A
MPEPKFAVVDVETTGLNPRYHHRIAEVAVVTVSASGEILERWETLVNPERDLGPQSIHGIRAAEILDAPTFTEIIPELAHRFQGNVLVAHNLSFDSAFLRSEFERSGAYLPEEFLQGICTMRLSHDYVFGNARSLAHCCEFLSVATGSAHSAGDDAEAAAGLLARYMDMDPARPDWEKHLSVAQQAPWPAIVPSSSLPVVLRRQGSSEPEHFLNRITAHMPEFTGAGEDEEYLMLLDRAMLDRHLSVTEQRELVGMAETLGLTRQRCLELHSYYVEELLSAAWADGVISDPEEADLRLAASVLGVPSRLVDEGLASRPVESPASSAAQTGTASILPGAIIVLTGTMTRPRAEFAEELIALGYGIGDNVTKKTSLVVAADPDSLSGKAAKARKVGIPVVGEDYLFTGLGLER